MYYYLVDPANYDGKNFEFFQTQLLSFLGEYHISGEVARVTRLRTVEDLVATALSHGVTTLVIVALSHGVTTLVIVGSDETFHKAVSVCHGKPVTLGFIPVRAQSETAKILGIEGLLESVITIAKRRVESLDLACVGQTYFISNLFFRTDQSPAGDGTAAEGKMAFQSESPRGFFSGLKTFFRPQKLDAVEIRFDRSFKASGDLFLGSIINASDHISQKDGVTIGDPKDGLLDIVLVGRLNRFQNWKWRKTAETRALETFPGASIVHAREVEILSPVGLQLFAGPIVVATAPTRIFLAEDKVRVIVGKSRTF
ncbi:MAG: hypothetical protein M1275_00735 [Patescibacteria group bacterium]|nr:hypothetical protein [Patescibacteria group bacterium]